MHKRPTRQKRERARSPKTTGSRAMVPSNVPDAAGHTHSVDDNPTRWAPNDCRRGADSDRIALEDAPCVHRPIIIINDSQPPSRALPHLSCL
eukprot:1961831-Prymnesium_polylepis.1